MEGGFVVCHEGAVALGFEVFRCGHDVHRNDGIQLEALFEQSYR